MIIFARIRRLALVLGFPLIMAIFPAGAQEISDSHLAQARTAVAAIRATDQFDAILPGAAQALKEQLIQKDPNLIDVISTTVDEETIKLASRRGDLERESALAYARVFSEEELKEIAAFYQSPAGKKLITDGPITTREMLKAGEIWQAGIARDLAEAVAKRIQAAVDAQPAPIEPKETPAAQ